MYVSGRPTRSSRVRSRPSDHSPRLPSNADFERDQPLGDRAQLGACLVGQPVTSPADVAQPPIEDATLFVAERRRVGGGRVPEDGVRQVVAQRQAGPPALESLFRGEACRPHVGVWMDPGHEGRRGAGVPGIALGTVEAADDLVEGRIVPAGGGHRLRDQRIGGHDGRVGRRLDAGRRHRAVVDQVVGHAPMLQRTRCAAVFAERRSLGVVQPVVQGPKSDPRRMPAGGHFVRGVLVSPEGLEPSTQ